MNKSTFDNSSGFHCGVPPYLFGIPDYVNYIQGVLFLLVALVSFALNGFTVFLIIRHKRLHQRAFYLAFHICSINLLFTTFVHITSIITAFAGSWLLGDIGCQAVGFFHDTFTTMRFMFSLLLGVDRLMTIFCPFWYKRNGSKTVVGMVIVLWVWSVFRGVMALGGLLDCYVYIPTFKSCQIIFSCSDQCYAFGVFTITFTYTIGTFVPFFLYIILFGKGRQVRNKLMEANASEKQRYQHNWRAIITFTILFIALIGCSLPPIIIFLAFQIELAVVGRPSTTITLLQLLVGRVMFLALVAIDPCVILRNQDVRECLKTRTHLRQSYHSSRRSSQPNNVINSDSGKGYSIGENGTPL